MRRHFTTLGFTAFALAACSSVSDHRRAEGTVRLASRAITNITDTSGGEAPEQEEALSDALQESRDWLAPAETALDLWDDGGDIAFGRAAACLGVALARVRDVLITMEREVPVELTQAEAQASSMGQCGSE